MLTKQLELVLTHFEQNNNKVKFYYTLTNKNPGQQIIKFYSSTDKSYLNLIDQNGFSYLASEIKLGQENDNEIELIYNVGVNCYAEFDVGMNKISKVAKLDLNGYNYEFRFINLDIVNVNLNQLESQTKNNINEKSTKKVNDSSIGNMELNGIKIEIKLNK